MPMMEPCPVSINFPSAILGLSGTKESTVRNLSKGQVGALYTKAIDEQIGALLAIESGGREQKLLVDLNEKTRIILPRLLNSTKIELLAHALQDLKFLQGTHLV